MIDWMIDWIRLRLLSTGVGWAMVATLCLLSEEYTQDVTIGCAGGLMRPLHSHLQKAIEIEDVSHPVILEIVLTSEERGR